MRTKVLIHILVCFFLAGFAVIGQADEDDDDKEKNHNHTSSPGYQDWKTECGACHFAYPAEFLPRKSWVRIMQGLSDHFGEDASLEADELRTIQAYLENHASRSSWRKSGKLRITETYWFRHEHDEVPSHVWQRESVGGAARCQACHRNADNGDFDEDRVRIPGGT